MSSELVLLFIPPQDLSSNRIRDISKFFSTLGNFIIIVGTASEQSFKKYISMLDIPSIYNKKEYIPPANLLSKPWGFSKIYIVDQEKNKCFIPQDYPSLKNLLVGQIPQRPVELNS